jgi:flagellar basal body-associated protein FliL
MVQMPVDRVWFQIVGKIFQPAPGSLLVLMLVLGALVASMIGAAFLSFHRTPCPQLDARTRSLQAKQKDINMKTHMTLSALALALAAITMLSCLSANAHGAQTKAKAAPPAAPMVPEITIDTAFRAALASGNAQLAASYLSDDVLIFEGGHIERSKAEHQSHHLNSDIAFASATQYRVLSRAVKVVDDTAWTTT